MGKHGKLGDNIDPAGMAKSVVESWVEKVQRDAEIMGDNYLQGIQSANTEEMKIKLALWYQRLPQVASAYRRIWRGAPAPGGGR